LHTFFELAQFCKKPCNLVFNVLLEFFYKKNVLLFFIASVSGHIFCIAGARVQPRTSPRGKVALSIVIPSDTEQGGLFFKFIADTKSERIKNLKPCSRTTQFSTGLHCQPQNQRRTELDVRRYLASRLAEQAMLGVCV
jgi:hypothetical protein